MKLNKMLKDKKMCKVVDMVLEESCRQWCEFIEEAPERKDGTGFAEFFHEIFEEKGKEYADQVREQESAAKKEKKKQGAER